MMAKVISKIRRPKLSKDQKKMHTSTTQCSVHTHSAQAFERLVGSTIRHESQLTIGKS